MVLNTMTDLKWYEKFDSYKELTDNQSNFIQGFVSFIDFREYTIEAKGYNPYCEFVLSSNRIKLADYCKFVGVE